MAPMRSRDSQRGSATGGFKTRRDSPLQPHTRPPQPPQASPASAASAPATPPQLLQSVYDTYAENIHAISVRASSNSALSGYGASGGSHGSHRSAPQLPRRRSTSASSSSHESDYDWRLSSGQTGFHLISFMAGSGLVFLPLALVDLDWYGVLVLALAAAICVYTSRLLIESMDLLRWSSGKNVTYCDLARECLGRNGYFVTAFLLHGGFLVSATGYVALVTSCITGMTGASYGLVLVFVGIGAWLHVLVKSLKALAVLSAINVGVCFWVEAVIFGDAMYPLKQIALDESAFIFGTPDLSNAPLFLQLAYAFSLLASGFFCHSVIPTFYNAMSDHRQCSTVVARSQVGVLALLYLPVCVVTYAVYGATLQAPVFFNMRNPVVRNLAVVLYCVHLLLSHAVTLAPLQRALERRLGIVTVEQRPLLAPTPAMLGLLNHSETQPLKTSEFGGYEAIDAPPSTPRGDPQRRHTHLLQLLVRSATVAASVALAFVFRPTALGTFGATIIPATTLALILPGVFFWKLCTEEAGCLDKLAVVAIAALAAVSMVASVYTIVVLG